MQCERERLDTRYTRVDYHIDYHQCEIETCERDRHALPSVCLSLWKERDMQCERERHTE